MSMVTCHVSHPYSSTDLTLDRNILNYTLRVSFATRVNLAMREVTFSSITPVSDTILLRQVNLQTRTISSASIHTLCAILFIRSYILGLPRVNFKSHRSSTVDYIQQYLLLSMHWSSAQSKSSKMLVNPHSIPRLSLCYVRCTNPMRTIRIAEAKVCSPVEHPHLPRCFERCHYLDGQS